jgi:four helix bundle protein
VRDFTKIEAWRLADDLTVSVYERSRGFPKEETYGITSQLRRAASSVAANIAEGPARETKRDYLHFLYIARGSLAETQYFIHLAHRLGYLNPSDAETLSELGRETFACLLGLIRSVEKETSRLSAFASEAAASPSRG